MRKLRVFDTQVQYDNVKCDLGRAVIKVRENKSVNLNKENYFIAIYNVTSTSSIKLFDSNCISYIKKMYIDDVEVTPTSAYTFSTIGEHKVKCICNFCKSFSVYVRYMFQSCYELTSLDLSHFDTSKVTNMEYMFSYCNNLTSLNISNFDTSNVTNMRGMFNGCSSLTSLNVTHFDTSNVTDMGSMFNNCYNLTSLNVTHFDTSNVTNMSLMFSGCKKITSLNVTHFDTSNVTNMGSMFSNCSSLTSLDVSNFDTSKVTYISGMFSGCEKITSLNVTNFDTSKVTNMQYMFQSCSSLTSLDVSNFDTSKVTYMNFMFNGCSGLTSLDVSNWNTINVTNMSKMFNDCYNLTSLDVSNFDTSKVLAIVEMFNGCYKLTSLDVSNWNTSKVTGMGGTFARCSGLTSLDVSNWNTSKVTEMSNMFYNCVNLTSLDVSNFDTSKVTYINNMFQNCYKLTSLEILGDISKITIYDSMFDGISTNGTLTINCDYQDAWNTICVTKQSTSKFPSTWTIKCDEFVDLGLPSGLKWASCNVGASVPEEFGLYFAWGETEGYSGITAEKGFYWGDYKYTSGACTGATDDTFRGGLTKYNTQSVSGTVDNLTTLELVDDAAYVSDNTCRIPTSSNFHELMSNTTLTWETLNGVYGMRFTSKTNGNSIFIPAAGCCYSGSVNDVGSIGYLWSSSLDKSYPYSCWDLALNSSGVNVGSSRRRCGLSIRAVK